MDLGAFYAEHGLWIVFGTVLVQQFGLPVPAFPLLILAGAQTLVDPAHGLWALVLSVVASSLGNYAWFIAGRRYGHRVLEAVCNISLSPDSCVRQAENAFERYGAGSLVLGRFVPGLGIVAPPLAGGFGVGAPTFLLYNGRGSAVWGRAGIARGWAFHTEVEWCSMRWRRSATVHWSDWPASSFCTRRIAGGNAGSFAGRCAMRASASTSCVG